MLKYACKPSNEFSDSLGNTGIESSVQWINAPMPKYFYCTVPIII